MEVELKLDIDAESGARAARLSLFADAPAKTQALHSKYFDTPDHDLRKAGFALRIRRQGKKHIQTVKAERGPAAGLFVRPEWEHPVSGAEPVFTAESGPLRQVFGPDLISRIGWLFTTRVKRSLRLVSFDGADIEVAIDLGALIWDERNAPIHEIELELKAGAPKALFKLARLLNAELPVRIGVQSKAERGYALVQAPPEKAKRADILLSPQDSAADAFVTILQGCIRHYRLNETVVLASGETVAVHQARVALRQIRTAFWLFKPALAGDPEEDRLRGELKRIASAYGEVRNIDVLVTRFKGNARKRLAAARQESYARLCAELDTTETRLLMIDLAEWLALGHWRTEPLKPRALAEPAIDFASAALRRVRKRLKRKGKTLSKLDPETRHKARIEAKRLRYATEFFASLYTGNKAKRRLKAFRLALADLQDVLGELNDQAMAPDLLKRLGVEEPLPLNGDNTPEILLRRADDTYDALLDTKPFWRG